VTGLVQGLVALVTGGGSGIGAASARLFAAEGAQVAVADVDGDRAADVAADIVGAGGEAIALAVDVADEASVVAMVAAVVDRFGRLDCVHNNAGVSSPPFATIDMTLAEWERMIAVNLTGVFLCVREELKVMVPRRSGAIVNTSSGAGVVPAPGRPHYTAAKHGVLGLTKVVAREHAADGIRVNAVLPGIIHTPMIEASFGDDATIWDGVARSIPAGRLGRPDEVAEAAVWLCSPRASFVNGEAMAVDGATVTR